MVFRAAVSVLLLMVCYKKISYCDCLFDLYFCLSTTVNSELDGICWLVQDDGQSVEN